MSNTANKVYTLQTTMNTSRLSLLLFIPLISCVNTNNEKAQDES